MSKSTEYLIVGLLWSISSRQVDGWAGVVFSSLALGAYLLSVLALADHE